MRNMFAAEGYEIKENTTYDLNFSYLGSDMCQVKSKRYITFI